MIYSIGFLAFVAALVVIYYIIPSRWRWIALLAGSYGFYFVNGGIYVLYLLFTTALSFFGARKLDSVKKNKELDKKLRKRRRQLIVGLVVAVLTLVLALFKYEPITARTSLVLPLGISYFTFMVIGYLVDVYRGEYPAEENFFHYALFVSYFPALIQGPINRFGQMREQFFAERKFSFVYIRDGIWLFLWGLFKKLVIADRAAIYVREVITVDMADESGSLVLVGLILFVVWMYCDFSGGIDMAEGISEMLGIKMYRNFNQPFHSQTIGEFWRRWHISLGNWIRDYVFYPLAFSKTYRKLSQSISKKSKHLGESIPGMIVSVITFVIIGLWHEISLLYLCYGLWYGLMIGLSKVFEPLFRKLNEILCVRTEVFSWRMFRRARTWLIVLIGESLCIIPGLEYFDDMLTSIFTNFKYYNVFFGMFDRGLSHMDFLILVFSVGLISAVGFLREKGYCLRVWLSRQNIVFIWALTFGMILFISIFGIYGPGYEASDFIYGGI